MSSTLCSWTLPKLLIEWTISFFLVKLRAVGLGPAECRLVESYLLDRHICTRVDGTLSSFSAISSGVPQGSVLGPLLFIIYYHDLPSAVQSASAMFADDTLLYNTNCDSSAGCFESSSTFCSVSSDQPELNSWALRWNSVFNAAKSADMLISRRSSGPSPANLLVQGVRVPRLTETRHLGVVLKSKLTWGAHIQCVVSKALPKIVLLKRMAYYLNLPAFAIRRCYIALVRPILEYASPVWNNCTKVDALHLEKL